LLLGARFGIIDTKSRDIFLTENLDTP